jgi:hypothetical protein
MMIMQAIRLARSGRRVCLMERSSELGGNWQTVKLENGDAVEIACHLIEVFPGIYDLLEDYSGIPFVRLDVQPVRVTRHGLRVPYFSRFLMLASGARLIVGLLRSHIDVWRGAVPDRNSILNFQTKLASYLKYQLPVFFKTSEMKGPDGGFVHFISNLCDRAREAGVLFRQLDVTQISSREDGLWNVESSERRAILTEGVHVTTSTNLEHVAPGKFVSGPQKFRHRVCVVVDVPREDVIVSHTYVEFWADSLIARIARIDHPGPSRPNLRYLVEFHSPDLDSIGDWKAAVTDRMLHSGIVERGAKVMISGQVDCMFTANVDQFRPGNLDRNFWAYYSTGNLAAGLAAWCKTSRPEAFALETTTGVKFK